jgi:hypothetical protein
MIQIKKGDYTKSQLKEYAASQYELANHCGYEIRNLEQKAFDYMLKDDWDSERAIGQQLTTMKKKKENFEKNVEELRKLHDDEVDSICFLEERDAHTTTDTTDTTNTTNTTNTPKGQTMETAQFYLDCTKTTFQGYHKPTVTWNGFACPMFTLNVVQAIIKQLDIPFEYFSKTSSCTPTGEALYESNEQWTWSVKKPTPKPTTTRLWIGIVSQDDTQEVICNGTDYKTVSAETQRAYDEIDSPISSNAQWFVVSTTVNI